MSTEEDRDMSDFDGRLRQQLRAIHDDINPGVVEAAFKRYEERIMGTNGHIRTPGEPANTMSRMQDQVDRLVNSDVNYAGDLVKAWGEVVELHEATKAVSQGFLDRAIRAEELNKLNIETFNKNEHAYIERALKLEDEVVELRAKVSGRSDVER